jgi:hypothetical protein
MRMMAEQREHDQQDDDNPEATQAIAAVITSVIAVIAAASAKQKDEDDNYEKQRHGAPAVGSSIEAWSIYNATAWVEFRYPLDRRLAWQ